MGGTEKEADGETSVMKNKEDVSDAIISKLLNDFNSADLLTGSLDSSSNAAAESIGYEGIVSSLKHLHLKKPAHSRQKFKERKYYSKKGKLSPGNKYNLSVAAVSSVERPIVWPGKLSNPSKKDDFSVLHPSRLLLGVNHKHLSSPLSSRSAVSSNSVAEKSRIKSELQKQNIHKFGRLSESCQNFSSFSGLSEVQSLMSETISCKSTPIISAVKRHNSSAFPDAKHPRLYSEVRVSSDIAHCLDYRCNNLCSDNTNENCDLLFQGKAESVPDDFLPSQLNKVDSASCSQEQWLTSPLVLNATSVGGSMAESCSDDIKMEESNVNELASYFDDLLHIPRKMSIMAEMMYA